jgi:hypothetical protein
MKCHSLLRYLPPARQALAAATSNFEEILGWSKVGQVRAGYNADLLVLNDNPITDVKNAIGQIYGFPPGKTVQEGLFQGGKYCDWTIRRSQQITPLLAKRTGRPVRCVNTRRDTFDFMVQQRFMHMKVGFKKDGLITAFDDFSIADGGTTGSAWNVPMPGLHTAT